VTDIDAGDIIVGDNYLKYNGTCWCLKSAVFDELSAKTQDISDNSKKVATTEFVKNAINQATLEQYEIGDLFFTTKITSPASKFGGTWAKWGEGRVPVGVDTGQTEFNTVEKTGGEKTHSLTANENGTHSHSVLTMIQSFQAGGALMRTLSSQTDYAALTENSGLGTAHNNLQPYITCYMWKRIS
jgi:hypothetical protein